MSDRPASVSSGFFLKNWALEALKVSQKKYFSAELSCLLPKFFSLFRALLARSRVDGDFMI